MFPSAGAATSPRRQSVTYPGYQAQYADYPPAHGGYGGHGPGEAAQPAAQWPGYHGLYTRYDADWNSVHHAATAAAALSAASHHFQPPSPAASAPHGSAEAGGDAGPGAGLYGGGVYVKPGSLCAPASGDFKPPLLGDVRGLDDHGGGAEADPLRSQSGAVAGAGGRAHHSPDSGECASRYICNGVADYAQSLHCTVSGLAASDGVSGSDSPNHVLHPQQPPSPGLHHDLGLPARPQPARSPYEWMKRPSISGRPCKEGSDGNSQSWKRTFAKFEVVQSRGRPLLIESILRPTAFT